MATHILVTPSSVIITNPNQWWLFVFSLFFSCGLSLWLGSYLFSLNLKHTFGGLYLQELQEERNTDRYSAFALDEEVHTERRGLEMWCIQTCIIVSTWKWVQLPCIFLLLYPWSMREYRLTSYSSTVEHVFFQYHIAASLQSMGNNSSIYECPCRPESYVKKRTCWVGGRKRLLNSRPDMLVSKEFSQVIRLCQYLKLRCATKLLVTLCLPPCS